MDQAQRNKVQKHILWIDLEMTGLDPVEDRILEVGVIITDWNLKEVATYEAAIKVSERLVRARMFKGPAMHFWSSNPETRDALVEQSKTTGRPARVIEGELLALIDEYFEKDLPVVLAGNSVYMDRRFIEREWKKLNKRLHYRMLDVSAWKLVFQGMFRKHFTKQEAHRALDDIRGSIEELRYYLTKVKKSS